MIADECAWSLTSECAASSDFDRLCAKRKRGSMTSVGNSEIAWTDFEHGKSIRLASVPEVSDQLIFSETDRVTTQRGMAAAHLPTWRRQSYRPEMFSAAGLIHCSSPAQVLQVSPIGNCKSAIPKLPSA